MLFAITAIAAAAEPVLVRMDAGQLEGQLIRRPTPEYPLAALDQQIQGTVRFVVRVDSEGRVSRAVPISGNPVLLGAARNAVDGYRYRPMRVNGRRVEMTGIVDIVFELPLPPGTRVALAANWYRA